MAERRLLQAAKPLPGPNTGGSRRVTIPASYWPLVGLERDAECESEIYMVGDDLLVKIRPARVREEARRATT